MSESEHVGAWRLVRPLAAGGFGDVMEVVRDGDGVRGALKRMQGAHASSPSVVARFIREAAVLRELQHPSIVRLLDAGVDERPYLVMELLDGETLEHRLERTGRLVVSEALGVLEALCSALATAHAAGVIHRDVKAANVMVCADRIVLVDFGIARLIDDAATPLTETHTAVGTPSCMAPEQIEGKRADARTDIYALGSLLFHMLAGEPPFYDPSPTMTQYLHQHARRPRVSAVAAVPELLDGVIARAMAIDPAQRYDAVFAVLAAARLAVHESSSAPAPEVLAAVVFMVTVTAPADASFADGALFDDLEAVMPRAERYLSALGIALAADLGETALFATPVASGADVEGLARALDAHLAARPHRHDRVAVRICVRRGRAPFLGAAIQPCQLLRIADWPLPRDLAGVWILEDG